MSKHTFALALALLSGSLIASTYGLDIAVYWGRDVGEGSLAEACATGNYAYVIIGFLNTFGGGRTPALNIAGHRPEELERQIKDCQEKNVRVLLSIGGPVGDYSLDSLQDARNVADYLYDNFLQGQSKSRPFGSAVLDGIDFHIMHGSPKNYGWLVSFLALRKLYGDNIYLTAAPQCPHPDPYMGRAIDTGLFDAVFVQFYDNPQCSYAENNADKLIGSWNVWSDKTKAARVFMGLPAHPYATGSGYMPPEQLITGVLPVATESNKFGGIMLWDRYWDKLSNYSGFLLAHFEPGVYSKLKQVTMRG